MKGEWDSEHLLDPDTVSISRASERKLSRLLSVSCEENVTSIELDGHGLVIPREALMLLRDVLVDMSQGKVVSVVPRNAEMTTQQAADILNVSRPHLVKLLESGGLEFTMVGTHRRIKVCDLMVYREKNDR